MAGKYWTLSKKDGTPVEARRHDRVNDINLGEKHVQAFRTQTDLLTSHWMESVAGDRDRYGTPAEWDLVHVDGDDENEIIPKKFHGVKGLFVKIYGELERTDLMEWLRASETSEDPELKRAAEDILMTIEVMAD